MIDAFSRTLTPAEARANLGVIRAQRAGSGDEARAALREAIRLDPDGKVARAVLGRLDKDDAVASRAGPAPKGRLAGN